ncbi:succinate dehydrogenase [uncultured Prochlorococcus sp.]|uniref:succinate dehydrogenase n=1 Tax=uncultured Prochlorococcus sp. TaxID=159733 RepID=UPI0025873FDB|nr:succinate dehydrogenase [uncultured Prochlorococcus sp.]
MELEALTQKFQSYSGLVLVFFIAVHLAGVIFAGINPDAFEIYASNLHSSLFLPYAEIVLAITFIIHIFLTFKKVLKNRLSGNKAILRTKRNDYLGVLASKVQPFTGVILVSFLIIHLLQLRFPRAGDNFELISLKNKLGGVHILVLYSLASISLFFHMVQGIESGHRSLGILSQSNSLNIRYISRFISIFFGISYLIMTFYLRFK